MLEQVAPRGSLHELTLMDGVLCGETSLDRHGTLSENQRESESERENRHGENKINEGSTFSP